MTKKGLAQLTHSYRMLAQINTSSNDRLMEIVESSFSALATSDPRLALQVIKALNDQKEDIEKIAQEREDEEKEFIETIAKNIPDILEFEEEKVEDEP